MEKQEFSFLSADGKTSIHAAVWIPAVPVRAIVEVSHGVSEHILRYESLAAYLTERGFAVIGHDHLGHGSSVIPGAPRLYLGPPGSWETATRDLDTCRRLARKRFGRLPLFLLGHSMGSFLARTYLIRYPGTVDGAILGGTGQMSPAVLAVGSALARAECRRLGETQISPLVERLAFGPYNKPFSPARTPYDWLSLDPSNVDAYLADPLCGGIPTVGLFRELLYGLRLIRDPQALRNMNLATPVLFLSGAMDPVGGCGRGVQAAFRSFRRAGVRDVSLRLYPQLRHEILNEASREDVYQDLCQWLECHLDA